MPSPVFTQSLNLITNIDTNTDANLNINITSGEVYKLCLLLQITPVQDALELQEFSQRGIVTPSSYDNEGKPVHSSNYLVSCIIFADWVILLALFSLKQMESISQMLHELKYGWIAVYVKQPRIQLGWESATSNQEALAMQIMIKGCCCYLYRAEHVYCICWSWWRWQWEWCLIAW